MVAARRSLLWLLPVEALIAIVFVAGIRQRGGVTTLDGDIVAIGLLCSAGMVLGAAPIAYTRWLVRVFGDPERRLGRPG
jgi:hypothetical protein